MRFWEIAQPPGQHLTIEATTRFIKALPAFVREYSNLPAKLREFFEFRKTHPAADPFNIKDTNFNNPALLTKIKHVHLIFGKVILFYKMTSQTLFLYAIVDHGEYHSAASTARLVNALNNITLSDFAHFTANKPEEPTALTDEQVQEIKQFLWEMAADPETRTDLLAAANGDFAGVMDFLTSMVPLSNDALIAALGGQQHFITVIKNIVKHSGAGR